MNEKRYKEIKDICIELSKFHSAVGRHVSTIKHYQVNVDKETIDNVVKVIGK